MTHLMHISNAVRRGQDKERIVLRFLAIETFTDFETLCFLLQSAKSNTSTLLKRMVVKGFLIKRTVILRSRKVNLWGIVGEGDTFLRSFKGLRFSSNTLDQKLLLQRTSIAFSHLSWATFHQSNHDSNFRKRYRLNHYPDALVTSKHNDEILAIEVESRLKSPVRYRVIIKEHILAKRQGFWSHVVFVVRDLEYKKMLRHRFNHIDYIPFDESRQPFHCHESMISIFTIEEMSSFTP
ncbi:hypothetical protein AB4391_01580 [Vibrio lentus]|uniref:Mobilization protein n=1 Tax=Vibrio lentus TaxID=136468 RepID=A0A2N7KAU7_9VIBR|nr:hypothetical protein [Vibrio lentus]PMM71983.1 hypothetical protein BCT49_00315 [Vibrio lentus]